MQWAFPMMLLVVAFFLVVLLLLTLLSSQRPNRFRYLTEKRFSARDTLHGQDKKITERGDFREIKILTGPTTNHSPAPPINPQPLRGWRFPPVYPSLSTTFDSLRGPQDAITHSDFQSLSLLSGCKRFVRRTMFFCDERRVLHGSAAFHKASLRRIPSN